MRTSIALSCCFVLFTAPMAPAALAESLEPVCKPSRAVPPQLLTGIPGTYKLSNGDTLRLSRASRRYFADMKQTGRFQILPVSEAMFVEKGGPLRFEFSGDWPDTEVRITGLEQPRPDEQACGPD